MAVEKNIAILVAGTFNSGILATGPVPGALYNYKPAPPEIVERVKKIETVCRAHNVALPHAAMRFPLAHPANACIVLGAVKPEEVQRNVAGLTAPIPAALWRDLKNEKLVAAHAPVPG
jgi:D-threo-aldose 1-dehydrogenase